MNINLIYATNSGSTYLVAQIIQQELQNKGHNVKLLHAKDAHAADLTESNLTILGSPSWDHTDSQGKRLEGQPHLDFIELIQDIGDLDTNGHNFAIFGLGDDSYTIFTGAVNELETFIHHIHGKLITESLRINAYYFDQDNNDQKIIEWAINLTK